MSNNGIMSKIKYLLDNTFDKILFFLCNVLQFTTIYKNS